jgi:ribosomal protein S18 acetylase RimI-like enzyme
VIIRDATEDDLPEIVVVHQQAFDGFFLTRLGPAFLNELYKAFAFRNGGVLRVLCSEGGRILGFAGGTVEPGSFFHGLKKEKALAFLLRALPGFIKNPLLVLKKLWYAVFYKGEEPSTLSKAALLSSIGVLPEMAGQSLGKKLLADFEEVVVAKGVDSLFLTTDKCGNENVVAFYLKSGYEVESEFVQADGRKMLRLTKIFSGASE